MIEILLALVIDTFIITGINNSGLKSNFRNFFGIETASAIVGFLLGQAILQYVNVKLFYFVVGILIIAMQIIDIYGFDFPDSITALMIGIDSMFVFTVMPWFAIIILLILEAIAIISGTFVGSKVLKYVPSSIRKYLVNIVMVFIAIKLMI